MRRATIALLLTTLLALAALTVPVLAQTNEPLPTDDNSQDLEIRLNEAVIVAENAAADAERLTNLAFNLLGIFEAVSVAITMVGAALGAVGFLRLISAETNLTRAREDVQKEIEAIQQQFQSRRHEFEVLSKQVTENTENQRREVANSTLATALLSFGERQYRAADFVGAVNTYQRALDLDGNNPVTFYRLGYVYNSQGNLDAAEEHFIRSLEIDAEFAPAVVALGFVYRRKGEKMEEGLDREQMFNLAEKQMLQGLKMSPKLVDEDGESWWGALGGLYRRRSQVAQAIYAYEQATTVTPHSSYPFGNLATMYGRENNIEGMLRMYQRVERLAFAEVQAEVDNYWGYFDLLTAQLALGHRDKAEDNLSSVLETVPSDAVYALDTLVDTLHRVARVLEAHPQAKDLNEFAARIEKYAAERKQNPDVLPTSMRPEDTAVDMIPTANGKTATDTDAEDSEADARPEDVVK
jgi:tetratricopeptide (TPR) repeat protein